MTKDRRGRDPDGGDTEHEDDLPWPGKGSSGRATAHLWPGKSSRTARLKGSPYPQRPPADAATDAVENKGSGAPVDAKLARHVGGYFSSDLSETRVHDDPGSRQATHEMGARAFAHGNDIFLGVGESAGDTGLMAHELTHVAQQHGGVAHPQRKVTVGDANSPAEAEADAVAAKVVAGQLSPQALIVDANPTDGQALKSELIAFLKDKITAVADAELGPAGSAVGCPYIEEMFSRYAGLPAANGEAMLRRWVPALAGVKTAHDMVPPILDRVRAGIQAWRQTGKPPPDLVAADPALSKVPAPPQLARGKSLDRMEAELGPGQPLDSNTVARMSRIVGSDVSGARVHQGTTATAMANDANATAFAVGTNVVLGSNAPRAGTTIGDALLAHELAHVAQQKTAASDTTARRKPIGDEEEAAERDAGQQRLAGFAGALNDVMTTGLQLQRCGGVSASYQAVDAVGPDVGKLVAVSHANTKDPWFNTHQNFAGPTVGMQDDEEQAFALAKTLGKGIAVIPANGHYYLYEVTGGGQLDLEVTYGENAGLQIQAGVLALINKRGVVWRANLVNQTNSARPSDGASADPFSAYQKLNKDKGGIDGLSEPELIATFEAAMYDTAMSVLAKSEADTFAKIKQFETSGATAPKEHVEIDETAKAALAIQQQLDEVNQQIWSMQAAGGRNQTYLRDPNWAPANKKKEELDTQKRASYHRYPMIGRYQSTRELQAFIAMTPQQREGSLGKDAHSVFGDILSTRNNIQNGDLELWDVPSIVDATMAGLEIGKDSPQREKIKSKASAVHTKETILSIALAVFGIGFGIASAVFTGGASLAFAAGSFGISTYDAIKSTEQYFVNNAATNTDTDPSGGLLPEEARQSWGWLVVAWAGAAMDFGMVLKAATVAEEVGKVAKGAQDITKAAEALAKGDRKFLAKLRLAAGDAALTDSISEALRPGLSARVGAEITIDGNLKSEVKVFYQIDERGKSFVTGIKVGTEAKVGDILAHAETVKALDRYSGLTGRIRQAWDRIRSFAGMADASKNPFEAGSKAFESWEELGKLDGLISYRRAQLAELLDKSPAATEAQAAIRKEIGFLENEVDIHERVVKALVDQKGSGFVAMSNGTKEALESGKRLPDFAEKAAAEITEDDLKRSAYYFERQDDGTFKLMEKVDRKAVPPTPTAPVAPPPLSSDAVTALKKSLGAHLPKTAESLSEPTLVALNKVDPNVLNQLKGATVKELETLGAMVTEDPGLAKRLVGQKNVYGALKNAKATNAIDLDRAMFTQRLKPLGVNNTRMIPAIERSGLTGEQMSKLTDADIKAFGEFDTAIAAGRNAKRPGEIAAETIEAAEQKLAHTSAEGTDQLRASICHQNGFSDLPFMKDPAAALRTKFPTIPKSSMDELAKVHPDALRALETASQEDMERIIRAFGEAKNPKDVEDILRSYMYKAQKNFRKPATAAQGLQVPENVGARIEESMKTLGEVRARGFPYGFADRAQYEQFTKELDSALAKRGIKGKAKVQGSAMHSKTPGDIDVEILVDDAEFERLAKDFARNAPPGRKASDLATNIAKRKIPSFEFYPVDTPIAETVAKYTGTEAGKPMSVQATLIVEGSPFDLGPTL